MKAAPNRVAEFRKPEPRPLALFTADDLREVETACKKQCREDWWGATVIGFLCGLLFSASVVCLLSF